MEASEEKRWLVLFNFGIDCHLGTLWFLKESLLKRTVAGYDQRSTRRAHPGLSVNRRTPSSLQDVVSMLIGTSKARSRCFAACDIMAKSEPGRRTYFSILRPVPVRPLNFCNTRQWRAEVERNLHKPKLTSEETQELTRFLVEGGLSR